VNDQSEGVDAEAELDPTNEIASSQKEGSVTASRDHPNAGISPPSFRATLLLPIVLIAIALGGIAFLSFAISTTLEGNVALIAALVLFGFAIAGMIHLVESNLAWRKSLIKSDSVALVPEKWGLVIDHLTHAYNENSKIMAGWLEQTAERTHQNTNQLSSLVDSLLTMKSAIEERDAEIKRLRQGYDYSILKRYYTRLIRLHRTSQEITLERPEDTDVNVLHRLMEDLLEDAEIEVYVPELNSDSRTLGDLIDDDVKHRESDKDELEHLVSEVIAPGYVVSNGSARQVLKPAKIGVYKYIERSDTQ
jgi:hypothetical protein